MHTGKRAYTGYRTLVLLAVLAVMVVASLYLGSSHLLASRAVTAPPATTPVAIATATEHVPLHCLSVVPSYFPIANPQSQSRLQQVKNRLQEQIIKAGHRVLKPGMSKTIEQLLRVSVTNSCTSPIFDPDMQLTITLRDDSTMNHQLLASLTSPVIPVAKMMKQGETVYRPNTQDPTDIGTSAGVPHQLRLAGCVIGVCSGLSALLPTGSPALTVGGLFGLGVGSVALAYVTDTGNVHLKATTASQDAWLVYLDLGYKGARSCRTIMPKNLIADFRFWVNAKLFGNVPVDGAFVTQNISIVTH